MTEEQAQQMIEQLTQINDYMLLSWVLLRELAFLAWTCLGLVIGYKIADDTIDQSNKGILNY